MVQPLFIATERFDSFDAEAWQSYFEWAKIPALTEVVSLDISLCPPVVVELSEHVANEDFRFGYSFHLADLLLRVQSSPRRNILGLYRNPDVHIAKAPAPGAFSFMGYDLIDEQTQISALTNCGGFPDAFDNDELNQCGLIEKFGRAREVRRLLAEKYPEEPHAQCEMYAVWRLNES